MSAATKADFKLPCQVQKQLVEAEAIQRQIEQHNFRLPKPGPQPAHPKVGFVPALCADSEAELLGLMRSFSKSVGPVLRGNKRLGRAALYADLIQYFYLLRQRDITLPRNKSLSAKACAYGLGVILRKHGCTEFSDNRLETNSRSRQEVASKMDRIFSRVAEAVENNPA